MNKTPNLDKKVQEMTPKIEKHKPALRIVRALILGEYQLRWFEDGKNVNLLYTLDMDEYLQWLNEKGCAYNIYEPRWVCGTVETKKK